MFKDLNIKISYTSAKDDLNKDFFIPLLSSSIEYERVAGYFSPKSFASAAVGFASYIKNGGKKIKIISSVYIGSDLYNALISDDIEDINIGEMGLSELITSFEKDYYRLFVKLLQENKIEMRVVALDNNIDLFHSKIGIFTDTESNKISFVGSINETSKAWAGNIEDFRVFKSWESGDYVNEDIEIFNMYWNGDINNAKVLSVNEAIIEKLVRITKVESEKLEDLIASVEKQVDENAKNPHDYQKEAISEWENNDYSGIYEMATGTGKTLTALWAVEKFIKNKPSVVVIVVPLTQLVYQWRDEVYEHNISKECQILMAPYSRDWESSIREDLYYREFNPNPRSTVIITTYDTFFSDRFKKLFYKYKNNTILLADEMHNIYRGERIRDSDYISGFKNKLGLSATPLSIWNENAEDMISLFGGIIFSYDLELALKNKDLTPFEYQIIETPLTEEEFEDYKNISRQLHPDSDKKISSRNKNLLQKRAEIKKKAANKLALLENLIINEKKVNKALFYVTDNNQLNKVQLLLDSMHIRTSKFTGDEKKPELRNLIIDNLENGIYDAIIAIKCLDEGVDIKSAQTAYLLSNNTEPREYIQRLGRVLRKHGQKKFSTIVDFIVTPPTGYKNLKLAQKLVDNELNRVEFFMNHAINKSTVMAKMVDLKTRHGVYLLSESEAKSYDK